MAAWDGWLFLFLFEPFVALGVALAVSADVGEAFASVLSASQLVLMYVWIRKAASAGTNVDTVVARPFLMLAFVPLIGLCIWLPAVELLRVLTTASGDAPTLAQLMLVWSLGSQAAGAVVASQMFVFRS